jgi:hypothetical protein
MADGMDLPWLRQLAEGVAAGLAAYVHREVDTACQRLGRPDPPDASTKRRAEPWQSN